MSLINSTKKVNKAEFKALKELEKYQEKLEEYEQKLAMLDDRIIQVNHDLLAYKAKVRERLTSEQELYHRSKRPIEPEAVFGQMKFNKQYKRFRHKGFSKVQMDFALFAMVFNIQKLWKNMSTNLKKVCLTFYLPIFTLIHSFELKNIYKKRFKEQIA